MILKYQWTMRGRGFEDERWTKMQMDVHGKFKGQASPLKCALYT